MTDRAARTAVKLPPLCKDCRYCRPVWSPMVMTPFLALVPAMRRAFWTDARCLHPSSLLRDPADPVAGYPPRLLRMPCSGARAARFSRDQDRCGPDARYFEARDYPAGWWTAGVIAGGALAWAFYFLLFVAIGLFWQR